MRQRSFASQAEFQKFGRKSRRELFLDEMDRVVPWSALYSLVAPHDPKAGSGRRPAGREIMLRTYFVQQWFNLSAPPGRLRGSLGRRLLLLCDGLPRRGEAFPCRASYGVLFLLFFGAVNTQYEKTGHSTASQTRLASTRLRSTLQY